MATYIPTIGLEVHAELKTQTKMFCSSKNDTNETRPNVNVCPICMAHPGTLPTINKEAVHHVLRVGSAVGGSLADFTEFDRKNYFYPDIPKGYQISQYKYPLVSGGSLRGIALTRIHLEEDTARSSHDKGDHSLVDYNRAGVPLMELVTEPVIHSGEEAGLFARELQLLLQYLGVADAQMEKGEMRVEANISVALQGEPLGTKVEVKNLNSFRSVERAIRFEIERHTEMIKRGEEIVQETRGWDEAKGETFLQREKESSHDYRYFPEPDLPKLRIKKIPEFQLEVLTEKMPQLPWEKREKYSALGLSNEQNDVLVTNRLVGAYFDSQIENGSGNVKSIANYITSDLIGLGGGLSLGKLGGTEVRELIELVDAGDLSARGAKDALRILFESGGNVRDVVEENGLRQVSDASEVNNLAQKIITEYADAARKYKDGNENSLKFLVGQGMKESKGSINPQLLTKELERVLAET